MDLLNDLPLWQACLLVFLLRVTDVTIGTIRTISVVSGHPWRAVALGFFEVLIWLLAISQVLSRALQEPVIALGYAAGYATGNGVGVLIERALSSRLFVLRLISGQRGREIAEALAPHGQVLATLQGESPQGGVSLVYVSATRRRLRQLVSVAASVDPGVFYLIEPAAQWSSNLQPLYQPTGWRAVFKRK